MSDLHMLSPLLDGMQMEETLSEKAGCACFALCNAQGERFVLKRLSYPSDASRIEALLLSGAYPDEAAIHAYYGELVRDLCRELDLAKELSRTGRFAGPVGYQVEPHETVGYDLYILTPRRVPLSAFLISSEMTNLRAVNLGIDLCDALLACRSAGCLFENLKPENIFLTPTGRFIPGDLGLAPLDDLQYASVSEDYLGAFSAPELSELSASPNRTIDLYALGMVLYYVYNAGHAPFRDENTDEQMAEKLRLTGKPLPSPLYADYEMAEILRKACAAKPKERFQNPETLKQVLTFYMQRNHISDTPIVPPLVLPDAPVVSDDALDAEAEPVRMTREETLDETFRRSFAPDRSGIPENEVPRAAAESAGEASEPAAQAAEEAPVPNAPQNENKEEPASETPQSEGEEVAREDPAPDSPEEEAPPETPAEEPTEASEEAPAAEAAPPDESSPSGEAAPTDTQEAPTDGEAIDELIASVSEVMRHTDEAEEAQPEEYDATYIDAEEPAPPPAPKKRRGGLIAAILVAVLAIGLFFACRWYFVSVDSVELSFSANSAQLLLKTDDSSEYFVVTCRDSLGNALSVLRHGDVYTVDGLTEKSDYTFTISAAEHHRLSGGSVSSCPFTAPELVSVDAFTAAAGENDGEVLLTVSAQKAPDVSWTLRFYPTANPEAVKQLRFDGESVLATGLQTNTEYTFELVSDGKLQVLGETSLRFTPVPIVRVSDFAVENISGTTVRLSWSAESALPASWKITCTADGLSAMEAVSSDTFCEILLPDLTHEYTFTLEAEGMLAPVQTTLEANPPVVGEFTAQAQDDGTLELRWALLSGSVPSGWKLSCRLSGTQEDATTYFTGETVFVLSAPVPNAQYEFTLTDAGGSRLFGAFTLQYRTAPAAAFTDYGVKPSPAYSSLWYLPEKSDWNYGNLAENSTVFKADDGIALCLQLRSLKSSNDVVRFDYLVRDTDGNVLSSSSASGTWSSFWLDKRHTAEIKNPAKAGSYVVEVYVNGRLLAETPFTVS